jgi:outer membrane lipoprotein-sorting protein
MNILRRLPLSRLLLLCGVIVAVGIGATALALAVGAGPTPPPKPLPEALHNALSSASGQQAQGVSARIQYTNHLLEGANLASGSGQAGELASNPLLSGATGRLWIGSEGHARLELQSEKGDTQILYDGHNLSVYDASTNTLYRYTPPPESGSGDQIADPGDSSSTGAPGSQISGGFTIKSASGAGANHKVPTVAEIEEGIARAGKHAVISGATPTDVAGQAAYTVRISPRENGGLIGGAELSWDASNGVPLRTAIYSSTSSSPVIELAATEISYGPVESSVLDFTPPANAKVEEVTLPSKHHPASSSSSADGNRPHVATHGKGLESIAVLESAVKTGKDESSESGLEGLQKVSINGVSASELPTQLGTLLSFERAGVRYVLGGSVTPGAIEEFARGL